MWKKIAVPLNSSTLAECVVPHVVALAGATDAKVVLPLLQTLVHRRRVKPRMVHVVLQPIIPRHRPLTAEEQAIVDRLVDLNFTEARRYLAQVEAHFSPVVDTRMLIGDNVTWTLHQLVEAEDTDLVLLSAHGYFSQSRYPFGSVVTSFLIYA
jgi:nucleotide-binding universal stress UspA family protein